MPKIFLRVLDPGLRCVMPCELKAITSGLPFLCSLVSVILVASICSNAVRYESSHCLDSGVRAHHAQMIETSRGPKITLNHKLNSKSFHTIIDCDVEIVTKTGRGLFLVLVN